MPKSVRMELDIYEMIHNSEPKSYWLGLKFNLSEPHRCRSVQEVADLPFISRHFREGRNEVYFQYNEEIQMHTVIMDPNPTKDTVVVAFAKFVEPGDIRAVDPTFIH